MTVPGEGTALDRRSFVPLYFQLQEHLKERLEIGDWEPGARMPSEPDLAQRYGVSRIVVRQALAMLENDGQIVRVRGSGTFVTQPKRPFSAFNLSRLAAEASSGSPEYRARILDAATPDLEPRIAEALQLSPDGKARRVTVLISSDDTPIGVGLSFIAPHVEDAGALTEPGRIIKFPAGLAIDGSSEAAVEASPSAEFDAKWLEIPRRAPVFFVISTAYDKRSVPVEFARYAFRADLLHLRFQDVPPLRDGR